MTSEIALRALAVVGVMACAGARAVSPAAAVVVAVPAPIALPGVTVQLVPALGDASELWVVEGDGEVERVVAAGLRAEVRRGVATLAEERFATRILAAFRTGTGWLFLSNDLVVARADSFLGALHPLGALPRSYVDSMGRQERVPTPSCGRYAFTLDDSDTSLWLTDGVAPLAPVRAFAPRVVLGAAFADASHGLVVVEGGELFATRDGGESFSRIALGTAAASAVACEDGALRVTTSTGVLGFDRELRPVPVTVPVSREVPTNEFLYAAVRSAAHTRYGALLRGGGRRIAQDRGRVVPWPKGALHVGFATADWGVAAKGLESLWLTQNGGASWRPITVAMTGLLEPPEDYPKGVACDATSCLAYGAVEVRFGGTLLPGDRVLATTIPRPPIPDSEQVLAGRPRPQPCEFTGPSGTSAGHPRDTTIHGDPDMRPWRWQQHAESAEIEQRRTRDGRWRIAWHGRDAQGTYGERVVSTAWPWSEPGASGEPPRPARVTREGVLAQGEDLVWIPAGGRPVLLRGDSLAVVEDGLVDALALPGGKLAVLMWQSPKTTPTPTNTSYVGVMWDSLAREWARLVIFDVRGRALARRDLQLDAWRSPPCALAVSVIAGVPGIGWSSCAGVRTRWFLPITPDSAARQLALFTIPPTCTRPAHMSDSVSSLLLDERLYARGQWVSRLRRVSVREGAAPCTQAVEFMFWQDGTPPAAREVFAVAEHGQLRAGPHEVRCAGP